MSKIKSETIELDGTLYIKEMTYRSSDRKFKINIHPKVAEAIGLHCVSAETEKACDEHFAEAMLKYLSLKKKEDKVILYRIDLEAKIKDARGKVVYERGHFVDDRGVKISFDYMVANRFRYGGNVVYHNAKGEKVWLGGESVMDWTPEREAFFAGLQTQLETAILRADKFFSKKSQALAKLIDAHALPPLLEGPRS